MNGTNGTGHWGGAMKLMVETTNINPLSIQFSTGGTPASIRQINSTLNHQSAILNQSNLSNRLSKLFQSTWLSRLFLWITFLGSLMPLKKPSPCTHSLGQAEAWREPWNIFSRPRGHGKIFCGIWETYAGKEGSFLCTMVAENLTLSPTATSRADAFFCQLGIKKQTQNIEKKKQRCSTYSSNKANRWRWKQKWKQSTVTPEHISKSARWKPLLGLRVVKKKRQNAIRGLVFYLNFFGVLPWFWRRKRCAKFLKHFLPP